MSKEAQPVRIITDVTADLDRVFSGLSDKPLKLIEDHQISIIPAYVNIGDKSFLTNDPEFSMEKLNKALIMDEMKLSTAVPSLHIFEATFADIDNGIFLSVGANQSNYHRIGSQAVAELGKQNQISVFDSGVTSFGLGLLALRAAKLSQEGKSREDILQNLADAKQRTLVFAALKTLDRAIASGRLNQILGYLGNLLKIKALIEFKNGNFKVIERFTTWKKTIDSLFENINSLGPLEQAAIIIADRDDDTKKILPEFIETVRNNYQGDIYVVEMGPALKLHTGLNAIGFAAIKAK